RTLGAFAIGRTWDLPVPVQGASAHARVYDHARSRRALALTRPSVLPSTLRTASAPGIKLNFRGSMAGLYAPLPTLHPSPRGQRCTARGQCGSLLLHCNGLSPSTPCRSPGALVFSISSPDPNPSLA